MISKPYKLAYKSTRVIWRWVIRLISHFDVALYMKLYTLYLKHIGIRVEGTPKFISADVYLDGIDYSLITLGDNIVISREVMFLTHDYSITAGLAALGERKRRGEGELVSLRPISIGNDCFIGARASILPGVTIGDNVIIGAGSVVVGHIPANSIAAGNPCRVIGETQSWARGKIETGGFVTEAATSRERSTVFAESANSPMLNPQESRR